MLIPETFSVNCKSKSDGLSSNAGRINREGNSLLIRDEVSQENKFLGSIAFLGRCENLRPHSSFVKKRILIIAASFCGALRVN